MLFYLQDLFDTDADIGPDDKSKLKVKKDSSKTASNAGLANYASEEGFNPFGSDARALLLKIQDWVGFCCCFLKIVSHSLLINPTKDRLFWVCQVLGG